MLPSPPRTAPAKTDHDLTPDSFRFLRDFVPVLKREWRSVRPRIGQRFFQEWRDMQRIHPGRLSPYEKTRILDPKPNVAMSNAALGHLAQAFPAFRNAKVAQHWAGVIDFTPDVVPVISNVDGVAGLTIATGFSGHGFGLGLGAGRLTADLVTGQMPIVDPAPFRFSRFTDGSKMIPLTGV
jgi:glycine/D-amino acid oxidase-like deaminating enzyme